MFVIVNKKIIISLIISIIIFLIISSFFILPKLKESSIKSEIIKANYCDVDSDCVDAGGKCPFDCYVYVNKNEVDRISTLIESFDSKCVYGCILCQSAVCENSKCEVVCN